MARAKEFGRDKDGLRLDFLGVNTVLPVDLMPPGKYPFASNVRRYKREAILGRSTQTAPLFLTGDPVHSLRRMNDTTPAGPSDGFIVVSGAGASLYADNTSVQGGMSGKRISLVPFRPNQSVQPWMYVADDNKMLKVRSDGTTFKMGIAEPQIKPAVAFPGGGGGINQILYRYIYRSSLTGAKSNPSPASIPGTNVEANSVKTDVVPTDIGFDPAQWEFVAGLLRTTGAATATPQLLNFVIGRNFGFAIPAGVTITGIKVDLNWFSQSQTSATIQTVSLYSNGVQVGTPKNPGTAVQVAPSDAVFGGDGDTWGVAGVTPAMLNDGTFGFGIQISVQKVRLFLSSFTVTVYYNSQNAQITPTPSTDPQVNKIDFYRFGGGLLNFTYVGTGPNSATMFTDTLSDLVAVVNPILEFDNFEPFPSIDLPRAGVVSVAAGAVSWVSGDNFNIRWLPGTIITIAGIAYSLDRRPTSTIALTVEGDIPNGVNVPYEIQQPILAAQPMRSMWGPTDNVAFMFAVGDTLRPGTLYFTKGNNPDAAPDTNQIEVTSPSEPLMNGCIVNGLSLVGSTERFWLAYPNFFNAFATVTGTVGSPFTLVLSISNRGLYARKGLCSDGGSNAFFIGKDGIYVSPGGNGSVSITDADLYNIFPHEGFDPETIVLGSTGITIVPPDFKAPDEMELSFSNGFLYFDYQDINGNRGTLVYDVVGKGWVFDTYEVQAHVHGTQEGPVEGLYVGCADGTIRELSNAGQEVCNATLALPSWNGGDTRAEKMFGDIFLEAEIPNAQSVACACFSNKFNSNIAGAAPVLLPSEGAIRAPYIIDFANGEGFEGVDIEAILTWPIVPSAVLAEGFGFDFGFNFGLGAGGGIPIDRVILYVWQPTLVPQPEGVQSRPTDWDDCGTVGAKFIQGLILEADTFGIAKAFKVQRGDDLQKFTPNESPVVFDGQSIKPFSFTPPFVAHNVRLISTDGIEWRRWGVEWIFQPYPESVIDWQTEGMSHGLNGWQHIRQFNIAHISTANLTLLLKFDYWPDISLVIPHSAGAFKKTKVTCDFNKFKIVSYRLSSAQPFRPFLRDMEVKVKEWGTDAGYQVLKPFGGPSSDGALV